MGFEQAMESVQQLARDGTQGLPLELVDREQMRVESTEVRVVLHGPRGACRERGAPRLTSHNGRAVAI